MEKPLILISNDDGFRAKGINCLVDMVKEFGDVIVCAPNSARSGFSTAFSGLEYLTLRKSNTVNGFQTVQDGVEVFYSNGTPVDCIKLAFHELCNRKPSLILSGINHGDNSTVNNHYSGTVGVAKEGCLKGIPSIAFSLCDYDSNADFEPMRPYVQQIVRKVLAEGLPSGSFLNVNFPFGGQYKGIRMCRMTRGNWVNEVSACDHPRGFKYYWLVGNLENAEPDAEDTDQWALNHGYIAITPTTVDVTDYDMLKNWKI
ncbi:MAG: 5'/3'-nucleotidase SurE [Bacteroidaceae bacterium]|nr:5'/3'-nucleotidase SurE [Bacteroidaceae bacterium]